MRVGPRESVGVLDTLTRFVRVFWRLEAKTRAGRRQRRGLIPESGRRVLYRARLGRRLTFEVPRAGERRQLFVRTKSTNRECAVLIRRVY